MANETQKFLSYEGLGTYDSKVKAYIVDKADAAKTSAIKADAVVVTTDVTLNADNQWFATWINLPEYLNGKKITYKVTEEQKKEKKRHS